MGVATSDSGQPDTWDSQGEAMAEKVAFASENMLFPVVVGNMSSQRERSIGTGLGRYILRILKELTSALVQLTRITRKRECTHRRANWKSAKCTCLDVASKYV